MKTTDKKDHPCKIVGISGSLRSGSYTTLAVALAIQGASLALVLATPESGRLGRILSRR